VTKLDSYSVLIGVESQLSRSLHMSSPRRKPGPSDFKAKDTGSRFSPGWRSFRQGSTNAAQL